MRLGTTRILLIVAASTLSLCLIVGLFVLQSDSAYLTPLITILGLVGISAALCVFWLGPKVQASHFTGQLTDRDKFDLENDIRRTLVQILGGTLALGTVYFAWANFNVSKEKDISDEFAKSLAQIEKTSPLERVAGIYSLERIANSSALFQERAVAILVFWLRDQVPIPGQVELINYPPMEADLPRVDIQTAINVLGRRMHPSKSLNSPWCKSGFVSKNI